MSFSIRPFSHIPLRCSVSYNATPVQGQGALQNRFIPFRFPLALVLSIVCFAAPAWADFKTAMEAYNRGDFAKALREWRPLAEQGDASAQFYLGLSYENGDGVPRDYAIARQWYEKSAAQGDEKAQLYLGLQSAFGQGGPVDLVQAHMWYSLAAEKGHLGAAAYRNELAKQMTPTQIAEAQKRARERKPKIP
jgi:TPR repeat protein